jgi:hypothetical protein
MAAGQISLKGVRAVLGSVRRTGALQGIKNVTSNDVKDVIRTIFHNEGVDQADRFVTGWNTRFDKPTLVQDVVYGADEIDYPMGIGRKLPKGAVSKGPMAGRANTGNTSKAIARRKAIAKRKNAGPKGGMR